MIHSKKFNPFLITKKGACSWNWRIKFRQCHLAGRHRNYKNYTTSGYHPKEKFGRKNWSTNDLLKSRTTDYYKGKNNLKLPEIGCGSNLVIKLHLTSFIWQKNFRFLSNMKVSGHIWFYCIVWPYPAEIGHVHIDRKKLLKSLLKNSWIFEYCKFAQTQFLAPTTKYYLHSEACVKHWDMQNLSKSRKYFKKHATLCRLPCSFSHLYNFKGYWWVHLSFGWLLKQLTQIL